MPVILDPDSYGVWRMPSELVSSWYSSWMCDRGLCSPSVSFGETLAAPAAFFFANFRVHSRGGLDLRFPQSKHRGLGSTADPIPLPKLKPRAVHKLFVVPAIGSRNVACAEWPNIGRFEHFL